MGAAASSSGTTPASAATPALASQRSASTVATTREPFAAVGAAQSTPATSLNLDAVRIPPIEALSPVAGLNFGDGLQLEPALLLADVLGLAALAYVVRRHWLRPPS
ncbi:MAG TPA: hypothetical protein VNY76_11520 [Candidatus Acidoferrales bacterium]|nr:hypothetical protein [Candidatus Acidoferrales bacterium]